MTSARDGGSLMPPHLGDAQLVAYLDGELSRTEMEIARTHVETCWTCRRRLSTMLTSIEKFLDSHGAIQPDANAESAQRIRQFRERLARHAAEVEARLSWGERMRAGWSGMLSAVGDHRRAAVAVAAVACLLIALFTDVWTTRVSADTVLDRVASHEMESRPQHGEVARHGLRLERVDRKTGATQNLGEITLMQDSETTAEMVSVRGDTGTAKTVTGTATSPDVRAAMEALEADLPRPIAAYLAKQNWTPSLSVDGIRRLLQSRGESRSTAAQQEPLFVLQFPFAPGHESGISEIRVIVESRNYAPIGLSFFTADQAFEYRYTRTTMAIEPRTPELAKLFGMANVPQRVRSQAPPELAKVRPLTYEASQATTQEVRLAAALHQSDACLGEEIHVIPMSDGALLVQGIVDTAERRDAIRRAVRSVDPGLRTEIYLPRELKAGSQLYKSPYKSIQPSSGVHSSGPATLADLSSERIPIYEELYHHFSKPGVTADETERQINAFSSEAVTLARQTFLHAWALKKLDDEFAPHRTLDLPPRSLEQVEKMRQDHRRWIATLTHRQAEMLAQAVHLPSNQSAENALQATSDSDALVRLAQEQNDLVRALFTVSSDARETQPLVGRLLTVLRKMGA